jgi:hypothetical protein
MVSSGNNPRKPVVLQDERTLASKEKDMRAIHTAIARQNISYALVLLGFCAATVPGANANNGPVKPAVQPAAVIAHMALPGASVSQLVLQEHDGKQYLYVEQASKQGFAIVDVTKPSQPNIIKREAWPNKASAGKLQMVGGQLALAEAADTATAESRAETLTVLDLSDPANPRTILTFTGVTSTLADDARNLVYITNSDGLWILKHQPEQAKPSEIRGCRSEDATNELASCQ